MWKYIRKYIPVMVLSVLSMVGEVIADLLQPKIMSSIVDDGVLGGDVELIISLGLRMLIIVAVGILCGSLCSVFSNIASENVGNLIRRDCFDRIMSFSFPQVDRFGPGALITRVTNDVTQVQMLIQQFIRNLIRTSLLFLGSIYFLFSLYPQFGRIALISLPFIVGVMGLCIWRANPSFAKMQEQLDAVNAILQEDVSGIRIIKACVREIYERIRFGKANDALIGTQLHVLIIFAFMNPAMNLMMYVVVILILLVGHAQAAAGPGAVMGAITYTTQLLHGIMGLVMLFQNISRGTASWKRLRTVLESEPELKDGSFDGETQEKGSVEFRDVSFTYPGTDRPVLSHINLRVHPGETLAIMGATGCGKTSLVNLIPRFYDVTGGAVLVDGVDVREYRQKDLRDKVAVALQKSELFSVSVKENILWGSPEATDEEVREAARAAQADGFVSAMKDGYDSIVAERGMSLSGGQKQRVSIARTVVKPAEILIFDDATSALDLKTEAALYEALEKSHGTSTKIIVAQRVASVRRADRIAVIDGGTIAACGSHEELMASCAVYQDIWHSQMGEGDR